MFNSKTLFIVGAGASKEAGLPIGNELTATIAKMVDIKFRNYGEQFSGEVEIVNALRFHARDVDGPPGDIAPYLDACSHIRGAMPQAMSIDTFIDHQGDDKITICGKLAIVRSILEAEKNSLLFVDERQGDSKLNFNDLQDTWYTSFMQILADGRRKENINHLFEGVSFITFNYDRCIEHFLFHALQNYYGIQSSKAADIMQELKIIHPYGMVGSMQWQGDGGGRPFGINAGGKRLLSLAGQIKTFAESVEDEAALAEIHQVVEEADIVVFLGFAFHKQNMELMESTQLNKVKRVFATATGISTNGLEVVQQRIKEVFTVKQPPFPIDLRQGLTCNSILEEYGLTLSGP